MIYEKIEVPKKKSAYIHIYMYMINNLEVFNVLFYL